MDRLERLQRITDFLQETDGSWFTAKAISKYIWSDNPVADMNILYSRTIKNFGIKMRKKLNKSPFSENKRIQKEYCYEID